MKKEETARDLRLMEVNARLTELFQYKKLIYRRSLLVFPRH